MREYLHDMLYCLKIAVYIFIPTFIVGVIIGWLTGYRGYIELLLWGCRLDEWIACIGLSLAGIGFWKREKADEESPQNERMWRTRFYRFKFPMVLFIISFTMILASFFIDSLL